MNIEDGITSIGDFAFANCKVMTSVTIPNSVTSIGFNSFFYCPALTSIVIPNSVTTIGAYAFQECEGLTSIEIPGSVTGIGDYAFSGCGVLTSVTVGWTTPLSVSSTIFAGTDLSKCTLSIPYGTDSAYKAADVWKVFGTIGCMGQCGDNAYWSLTDGVLTISGSGNMWDFSSSWEDYRKNIVSVNIEDGITSIGYLAFANCKDMTSVTIPNSVTIIGSLAFYH